MDPTPYAHRPLAIRCRLASIAVSIGCRPLPRRRLLSLLDQGRQPPSGVIHCHGRPPPNQAGQHPISNACKVNHVQRMLVEAWGLITNQTYFRGSNLLPEFSSLVMEPVQVQNSSTMEVGKHTYAECIVEAGNVIKGPMMIMVFVTSNIDLMVPAFNTTGD
uniref:Uncharacterized protein n=1 Tax=Oryza barthii TaxID=65489 RepID=A0A0D3HTV2_9ORYZ